MTFNMIEIRISEKAYLKGRKDAASELIVHTKRRAPDGALLFYAKKIGTGNVRFPFTKEKAFEKLPA